MSSEADERVDIVNMSDVLTGKTETLLSAHKEYLPHRVSAVLIFRPNGNVLMQAHKHHGRLLDHAVGGHVSAGETYMTAARREMQEELGLGLPLEKIREGVVSKEYYAHNNARNIHMFGIYKAIVDEHWALTETEEVDTIIEMSLSDVIERMNSKPGEFLQGFLTTMGAYLQHTGSKQKIYAYDKVWGEL